MKQYSGGCLCGNIRYTILAQPSFPHLCSCKTCQKWSGAITVAWIEFPRALLEWNGKGGQPAFYNSSAKTQRGFCSLCGGTLCAVDEGNDSISLTIASLDDYESIVPDQQHSYQNEAPSWWKVDINC